MTVDIHLDSAIRDYVLLPIVLVMFITSILRTYITNLLGGNSAAPGKIKAVHERQVLLRAARLRTNHTILLPESFELRKSFLVDSENGLLRLRAAAHAAAKAANPMQGNPASDPSMMVGMMKRQMSMVVPQIALMSWVNASFPGFVLLRFPFPLTLAFKQMLQRGVLLDTLPSSYVSSLSWYFLNVMGLRGLLYCVQGGQGVDDAAIMRQQMKMGSGQANPGAADYGKMYGAEADNLVLVDAKDWVGEAPTRLLQSKIHANS